MGANNRFSKVFLELEKEASDWDAWGKKEGRPKPPL